MDDKFEEVEVYNSINELEIGQVCSILEENNIPYVRKDDGIGSYMGIYMGVSYQPKRIYVDKKDYEKALKLIPFSSEEEENEINEVQEDTKEENINDEEQNQETSNNNINKKINIIAKIMFFIIVLVIICGAIMLL